MILEILEIFRNAAVAVVESGVRTIGIMGKAVLDAVGVVRSESSSAGPAELFLVLVLFGGGLYIAYKMFWDSAKTVFYFIAILAVLAALFFMAVV